MHDKTTETTADLLTLIKRNHRQQLAVIAITGLALLVSTGLVATGLGSDAGNVAAIAPAVATTTDPTPNIGAGGCVSGEPDGTAGGCPIRVVGVPQPVGPTIVVPWVPGTTTTGGVTCDRFPDGRWAAGYIGKVSTHGLVSSVCTYPPVPAMPVIGGGGTVYAAGGALGSGGAQAMGTALRSALQPAGTAACPPLTIGCTTHGSGGGVHADDATVFTGSGGSGSVVTFCPLCDDGITTGSGGNLPAAGTGGSGRTNPSAL